MNTCRLVSEGLIWLWPAEFFITRAIRWLCWSRFAGFRTTCSFGRIMPIPIEWKPIRTSRRSSAPLQGGSFGGLDYEFFEQTYQYGVTDEEFCGGTGKTSRWLTKDAIVSALRHFGHKEVRYGPDDVNHPNGPSACLFSGRTLALRPDGLDALVELVVK